MKIVVAIIIFSIIIIIHELGHFILAKANGVYVTEFSIGMGPRIITHKFGETRYSIKLFPFGGSCMMLGEDEEVENDDRAFGKKNVWARMSIIAAGPIFNFIFAFLVSLFVVSQIGYDPATILTVAKGSPAESAGLQKGDVITKIDGSNIDLSRDLSVYLQFNPLTASKFDMSYERDGKEYTTTIYPVFKETYTLGFSGTYEDGGVLVSSVTENYPLYNAGISEGDIILSMNGVNTSDSQAFEEYMAQNPYTKEEVEVIYSRDGVTTKVNVTPVIASTGYSMGISFNSGYTKTNAIGVLKYSIINVKFWIKSTLTSLKEMVLGKVSMDDVAGPVGVINVIGSAYEEAKDYGIMTLLVNLGNWAILISANLGVMNLLPIPALDGGRLVFLILEVLRGGKAISKEKEGMIHMIGLVALMILMVVIMFNDITNLF